MTPFTMEQELPSFDHGSPAYGYFRILRQILDKAVRATLNQSHLISSYNMRQIPRGMKINKNLTTICPTPKLELQHLQILARAEKEMTEITLTHYEQVIPKLQKEFDQYFTETQDLPPVDRRLIVLKLLHYKNEVIEKKEEKQEQKLYRPDNRRFNDNQGNQGHQSRPPPQPYQRQQGARPRSPREPQTRYPTERNPQYRQQQRQQDWQPQQRQQDWQPQQNEQPNYGNNWHQPSTSGQNNRRQAPMQRQQNMPWAPEPSDIWDQQAPRAQRQPRAGKGKGKGNRY
jgi:hypothetical protein